MIKCIRLSVVIPIFIFVAIFFIFWKGLQLNPTVLPSTFIGKKTPSFHVKNLYANQSYLSRHIFLHHMSLLTVWASWCSVCADEQATLMAIAKTHQVRMIGLNYKDKRSNAQAWLEKLGNPFEVIGYDHSGKVGINWGVYGTPETFLIDRAGVIRYKHIGPLTQGLWQKKILPMIQKMRGR